MRPSSRAADAGELEAVVARAKSGDSSALDALVRALGNDVFRLSLRMTAHPEDAEDATQEILIKIVTRLDSFRGKSSIRTWAYRIAVLRRATRAVGGERIDESAPFLSLRIG